LNDENSEVYQLIKNNKPYVLLESAGTKPNIFYIGLPENFEDKKWLQADFKNWQR
jgi:tetrathionate reductase subunit B